MKEITGLVTYLTVSIVRYKYYSFLLQMVGLLYPFNK